MTEPAAMLDAPRGGTRGEPRFVLGPLTLYADIAVMEAWLESAAPGAELIYATGPALGRDAPAGLLARSWADEGEVVLFQRRPGPGKPLEYVARRREPPVRAAMTGRRITGPMRRQSRPVLTGPADLADTAEGQMLALLTTLAEAGDACPNNRWLAAKLDLRSAEAARYLINKLVRAGLIRVEAASTFDQRTITIVNTGARTAAPAARGKRA